MVARSVVFAFAATVLPHVATAQLGPQALAVFEFTSDEATYVHADVWWRAARQGWRGAIGGRMHAIASSRSSGAFGIQSDSRASGALQPFLAVEYVGRSVSLHLRGGYNVQIRKSDSEVALWEPEGDRSGVINTMALTAGTNSIIADALVHYNYGSETLRGAGSIGTLALIENVALGFMGTALSTGEGFDAVSGGVFGGWSPRPGLQVRAFVQNRWQTRDDVIVGGLDIRLGAR